MKIYDFKVKTIKEEEKDLKEYKGKVLLIVNTATTCGLTHQYESLQQLYDQYQSEGFEILDFPCNQFGNQASESNEEINTFCTGRFGVKFDQFAKIDVNGEKADPLFTFLKNKRGGLLNRDIKWNFTKFLVDRKGNVVKRYGPTVNPIKIKKEIELLLRK